MYNVCNEMYDEKESIFRLIFFHVFLNVLLALFDGFILIFFLQLGKATLIQLIPSENLCPSSCCVPYGAVPYCAVPMT